MHLNRTKLICEHTYFYIDHQLNEHLRKLLLYISAMFAFKNASKLVNDKQALQERLKGVPSVVVDGLLSRFTETSRDKNQYVFSISWLSARH